MWWPFNRKYPERSPEVVNGHEYDYIVIGGIYNIAIASLLTFCQSMLIWSLDRWHRGMCLSFAIE